MPLCPSVAAQASPPGPAPITTASCFSAAFGTPASYAARMTSFAEIRVRVQPRASVDEVAGERAGSIVVRVTAPPVDGKANEAVRKLVAKKAGVPQTRVMVRGQSGRDKLVRVEGVERAALRRALLG